MEPEFLPLWRRFARAMKQRNSLLKAHPRPGDLDPWDHELALTGEAITRMRDLYLESIEPTLIAIACRFIPELGPLHLQFRPGWKRDSQSLHSTLLQTRDRDIAMGYGTVGPHRADWCIEFERLPDWAVVSRGQGKLVALACLLAQGHAYAQVRGEWPVIAFDDMASELDQAHQMRVLGDLQASGAQVLITGTEAPVIVGGTDVAMFHVEQGAIGISRRQN